MKVFEERDLHWLIDRSPIGILAHNRATEIILCNTAATALLCRTREQLLGRRFGDLGLRTVDESGRPLSADAYPALDVLHTRNAVSGIVMGIAHAGDRTWVRIAAVPRLDAGGEVAEIVCWLMDVSDDRRAQQAERRASSGQWNAVDDEGRFAAVRAPATPLGRLFPGASQVTRELRERIAEAAAIRKLPVLILGERGTGKAVAARAVHDLSPRAAKPFVAIDCTAIPGTLFESELFGHRKGAFTGAVADKPGLFQQADGGTLFLDEIAELSLDLQAKLLVAIQEHRVRQVGSLKELPVDVRIIAATNRDLTEMLGQGRFRHDLYDRLNGIQILVPPLRDRLEDLEAYVDLFVNKWASEEEKPALPVGEIVLGIFRRYRWPGNVRELDMTIGRMIARTRGDRLTLDVVPREIVEWTPFAAAPAATDDREHPPPRRQPTRAEIMRMLKRHRYNKTHAARALGISRDSLKRRVKRDGIPDRPDPAREP